MGTLRRIVSALVMAALLSVGALAVGMGTTAASAASIGTTTYCKDGQTLDCISAPRSIVKGKHHKGAKTTRYCIVNYKGHSVIKLVNDKTGKVVYVRTDGKGSGCATVPIATKCQDVTASGSNRSGTKAHSSATVCVIDAGGSQPPTRTSSGSLPFTGSDIIVPGTAVGLILVVLGFFAVVVSGRRREQDDA